MRRHGNNKTEEARKDVTAIRKRDNGKRGEASVLTPVSGLKGLKASLIDLVSTEELSMMYTWGL
jgi:hypothetical protein